jgi:hypothetical protein
MSDVDQDHNREVLLEAFTAGWQAALAVTISNPRVLAVVESCFDLWLREAVDEVDVLGLPFRGRDDLPGPAQRGGWPGLSATRATRDRNGSTAVPGPGETGRRPATGSTPRIPAQRSAPEDVDKNRAGPSKPEPRDRRRLLIRTGDRSKPKHRDATNRPD